MTITAFVLGGGGVLGAVEVGMLAALADAGIEPDLVVGTSIGAINGAVVAADPSTAVERLRDLWGEVATGQSDVYGSAWQQLREAMASKTHLHSSAPLRERLERELGDRTFDDLAVPFQCVAANIERAAEHWFSSGRVVDAVMASAAVPGLLPPAEVGGEHFLDGGIVNSIPVGRAIDLGADRVYVLQVGRVEEPLTPPTKPWEVARVSFEIARRHRYHREIAQVPDDARVHVLPSGASVSTADDKVRAYRDFSAVRRRMDAAQAAATQYLGEQR